MKNLIKTLLVIFTLALSINAAGQEKQKTTQTAIIKTAIYCDHCKECESCGGRILKQLYNEDGIKSTEVDPKAQTISVTYDSQKTTPVKIKETISKMGFDADEVKADPAAVAKLDDCCKK